MDKTRKRIGTVAAWLVVLLCPATFIAVIAALLLGRVEPDLWLPSTVGLCVAPLVTLALWLKPDAPAPPAMPSEASGGTPKVGGFVARLIATIQALSDLQARSQSADDPTPRQLPGSDPKRDD